MGTDETTPPREYRMTELAEAAGITVRTLRYYRERKLIPPPRREGRVAWYDDRHLARLRTIAALLERGHTLGGIAELIAAFEGGRGVAEILGLGGAIAAPWSRETLVRLAPEELADHFADQATPENLAASLDIGYLAVDGEELVHVSSRLLDVSRRLVREGVPLPAILAAGREIRAHADALAATFTAIVREHLLPDDVPPSPEAVEHVQRTLDRLRPLARTVVEAEVALAMDRRVRADVESWLDDGVTPR
ncbi:MerR family transcriptional regulator [Streptomyces caatingaensis]|uniref:MerR family transcriptional regulator n=1 Tax=Streptomyces caatingaensis TaxID=1678637 RepID=A0A0K9XMU9_9ACTN|nr:MerR family transcriptional regulator [Streptomyces caatingaensis]KNB54431.1 MerR family transcriptional regulator [Streptomyces caatingaensis]